MTCEIIQAENKLGEYFKDNLSVFLHFNQHLIFKK